MNKMVNDNFAEQVERVENPTLAKLIKAWESKQGRVAKQSTVFGLMAVSLAACGSSSSTSVDDSDDDDSMTVHIQEIDGDFAVDLGAGADTLSLVNDSSPIDEDGINGLNFSGGVTGIETLSFAEIVRLAGDAILDMGGISDNLQNLEFADGIDGGQKELTLGNSPVDDLIINATEIDDLGLNTGSVVNLDVDTSEGNLVLDALTGPKLETLALNQTQDEGGSGGLSLHITSDAGHDVSGLQSITAAAEGDAIVNLDADDDDADMNALTTVSVVAGEDAELTMKGHSEPQVQEVTLELTGAGADQNGAGNPSLGAGAKIIFDIPGHGDLVIDETNIADIENEFANLGYDAVWVETYDLSTIPTKGEFALTLTSQDSGLTAPVGITTFDLGNTATTGTITSNVVTIPGGSGDSFSGLEDVVVSGETVDVNLQDVYGSFTLDVTANGIEENGVALTTDVSLINTGVTKAIVRGGDYAKYDLVAGTITDADATKVDISGDNSSLTSLTVEGVAVRVNLADDLSSFTTLDLTGVGDGFLVNASNADFNPAADDYVSYLIGSTASPLELADSQITMADARETVTFIEADFGTVVLNGFNTDPIPTTGPEDSDQIDLSGIGVGVGDVGFEEGSYNTLDGTWDNTGAGDVRIFDQAGGPEIGGEIIVTGVDEGDLSANSMIYA